MPVSEPLPHFVDDLLGYLHETHPTHATLDGVHTHDDLLEDLSRHGIDQDARALAGYLRRLEEIDRDGLTQIEGLEHRMLASHLRGRMFELEAVRTWERNPQLYADILASSLAAQALFTHASAPERARRVLSKLRQTPRLIQAARDNIKDPPGIFVKVGIETMRGALKFIDHDLPRAFSSVDDLHLLGDLADAQIEASGAIGAYIEYLEKEVGPKARASFRLGRDKFEQKLRLEEGITLPIERLLAIAERELASTQEAFRQLAGKMNGGDPMVTWARTKENHPAPGELVRIGREQLEELKTFLERQSLITVPAGEPVIVAPTPEFYRWSFASMWTPGPFESKPTRAYYYLTDADPAWPAERQTEYLRDCNLPTLWSVSIHEVYPGHFLHYQHLRKVTSKARKSILFASASFVEGWAHYCEQMMIENGFGREDHSDPAGAARRIAHPSRPLHCRHQAAHRGHVGGAGRAAVPRRSVSRGSERQARSRTRHFRSDLPGLQRRKAHAAEAATGLQGAAGESVFVAHVPRHAAVERHRAVLAASSVDARGQSGRRAGVREQGNHAALRVRM